MLTQKLVCLKSNKSYVYDCVELEIQQQSECFD